MPVVTLPNPLLHDLSRGRVVLFLGAGASLGAAGPGGQTAPTGVQLAERVAAHFFPNDGVGGQSLDYISRLVLHHYSAGQLQGYIRELLVNLQPTSAHLKLAEFTWQGIVTTNYDLLVERAYERAKRPLIVRRVDGDAVQPLPGGATPYLKLHGCIDRIGHEDPPLILTQEHFLHYRDGREELFNRFVDWAKEYTLVFAGFSFNDWNFVSILDELTRKLGNHRNKYYAVRPGVNMLEHGLWNEKRIELIDATFGDFMEALDRELPADRRSLAAVLPVRHPIESRLKIRGALPGNVRDLLEVAEYVHEGIGWQSEHDHEARDFYRGVELGWKAIRENLDVPRALTSDLLRDLIDRGDDDRVKGAELYVIRAAAGEGKSVVLRRLAYDGARAGVLCLFGTGNQQVEFTQLQELHALSDERIFLFIDDAPDHAGELERLVRLARKERLPLTIITAARFNEYQTSDAARLDSIVNDYFELKRLHRGEIRQLARLLEKYGALGELESLSEDERVETIERTLDSQLLVALYQATLGRRFQDIILDEYNGIHGEKARHLYRAVAALHRLRIPVRSGLIARAFDISFEDFEQELFDPLSHIIFTAREQGEYVYRTRHPEIARIVFERAYEYPDVRFNEYLELLSRLNTGFFSDTEALRKMVQYRAVRELGLEDDQVEALYQMAFDSVASHRDRGYVLQQEALYSMHQERDLGRAEELLARALEIDPRRVGIKHSLAELKVRQSEQAGNDEEAEALRDEAMSLARQVKAQRDVILQKLGHMTMVKVYIAKVRWGLQRSRHDEVRRAVESAELLLQEGKRDFNDDGTFSGLEASLAETLGNSREAGRALVNALAQNQHNVPVAQRLAKWQAKNGSPGDALNTLREALNAAPANKNLHFQYGLMLHEQNAAPPERILHHFGLAFTPGDRNHEAQFWFARYAFEYGNPEQRQEALEVFNQLRYGTVGHNERFRVKDYSKEDGQPRRFTGVVGARRFKDGGIRRDGAGDLIYMHSRELPDEVWGLLERGRRVEFSLGFNYGGPIAAQVTPL
ncbi:hypothetical protein Dcar01_01818 [Deinococcus carri]|uniref:Novel STAND NTPase 5 domain-containing protein n=1 Tax=Deinococcus carri TaxID=1211323 RepID=A0ABP9W6X1_9DEIO